MGLFTWLKGRKNKDKDNYILDPKDKDYANKRYNLIKHQMRLDRQYKEQSSHQSQKGFFASIGNSISNFISNARASRIGFAEGLPISGGAALKRAVEASVMPTDVAAQSNVVFSQNETTKQQYDDLYRLSKDNHDVSMAVNNVVALANTNVTIQFDDGVSDAQASEMMDYLRKSEKSYYKGGRPMLVNSLLRQLAITGALSAEPQPNKKVNGIGNVMLLSPKWVYFQWDNELYDYVPYQQDTIIGLSYPKYTSYATGAYHRLNPNTYEYIAISRDEDKPYAIPPIISALRSVCVEDKMLDNLAAIVKRLGLLGFLEIVAAAPERIKSANGQRGETDQEYQDRVHAYLQSLKPEVEKSFANGYVVGLKQMIGQKEVKTDFKLQPTTNDTAGAKGLIELIQVIKSTGLKQNPVFLGKNFSTTEALAKVLLIIFTAQLTNYQEAVSQFLEKTYLLDLRLAGYKVESVNVTMDKPMLQDTKTQYEGLNQRFVYNQALYKQGLINQQQFAQREGLSSPAKNQSIEEERAAQEQQAATQSNKKINKELYLSMNNQSTKQYNYQTKQYLQATIRNFRNANTLIAIKIQKCFEGLEDGASLSSHVARAMSTYITDYHSVFTIPQMSISDKHIKESFAKFRKSKVVFGGVSELIDSDGNTKPIPEPKLSNFDNYTPKHFSKLDSSFIIDLTKAEKIYQKIDKVVTTHYDANTLKSRQFKVDLRKALGENIDKISQVVNTTMSKLKNIASLSYLQQANVAAYKMTIKEKSLACNECNCKNEEEHHYLTSETIENISSYYDGLNNSLNSLSTFSDLVNGFDDFVANEKEFRACKCSIQAVFE